MSYTGKNSNKAHPRGEQDVDDLVAYSDMRLRRAAGYVRVSTEEQSQGWSLDGQEEQIKKYADRSGFEIIRVYQDESSGSGDDRPGFDKLLTDAQAGFFQAVIVVHTSRLFRNVALARRYKELLRDKIGVQVISINQPILDPSDPAAFLMEGINELFDEYYIHQLRFWTKLGKQTRARRGLWNGTIPFGYERGANGVPVAHPTNADGIRLAFKAYSTGHYSDRTVAELLNREGFKTTGNWGNRPFTKDTVTPMLQNVFYLGLTKYKDQTFPGKHEPLISHELFNLCLEVRSRRRHKSRALGQKRRIYILSGLARCHVCGLTLRCQATQSGKKWRYYRHAATDRGHECPVPGKMIRADKLEEQWLEIVSRIQLPFNWRRRIEDLAGDADQRDAILREKAEIKERIRRLTRLYQDILIDDHDYQVSRDSLQQRLSALVLPETPKLIESAKYLARLDILWKAATRMEKRTITRLILEEIYIDVDAETILTILPHETFRPLLSRVCSSIGVTIL